MPRPTSTPAARRRRASWRTVRASDGRPVAGCSRHTPDSGARPAAPAPPPGGRGHRADRGTWSGPSAVTEVFQPLPRGGQRTATPHPDMMLIAIGTQGLHASRWRRRFLPRETAGRRPPLDAVAFERGFHCGILTRRGGDIAQWPTRAAARAEWTAPGIIRSLRGPTHTRRARRPRGRALSSRTRPLGPSRRRPTRTCSARPRHPAPSIRDASGGSLGPSRPQLGLLLCRFSFTCNPISAIFKFTLLASV
jgi:hypothetical protein